MNRDVVRSVLHAEHECFADEAAAIAAITGSLRADLEALLEQVRSLSRHSKHSSARVAARLAPTMSSIQDALERLDELSMVKHAKSQVPAWSATPRTVTPSTRVGKRQGLVEIY